MSYVDEVIDLVVKQNPAQPEFHQAVKEVMESLRVVIELNEEACLAHPYVEHNLRHYTGALTDIRPAKTEFYF